MTYNEMQIAKQAATDLTINSIEREVFNAFRTKRDSVLEVLKTNYAKYLVGVPNSDYYSTLSLYNRLQTMEKEIRGIYINLSKETSKSIINGQFELFDDAYYRSQYSTVFFQDSIGVDLGFSTVNPLVREASITGDAKLLAKIRDMRLRKLAQGMIPPTGTTLSSLLASNNIVGLTKVIKTVKQGLISGDSYSKQVIKVKKVFDGNVSNASRVIRSEGNRNLNAGSYLYSEELKEKVDTRRKWLATLDSNTRDSHQALDGQFEDKDGLWHIGSDSARYPGDFSEAENSIRCRCTTIDVVEGLEPTLRRGVNPVTGKSDIGSYNDYPRWKKDKGI